MPKRMDLNGWYKLRWKILERDKYTCQYCGQSAPDVKLEVDHRIALADGGTDEEDNLVTSCWACNRGKAGLRQSIVLRRAKHRVRASLPTRQNHILTLLRNNLEGLSTKEIVILEGITRNAADMTISRIKGKGLIRKINRRWYISTPLT